VRNHLEQQLGCVLVQRYKANFVNHNQLHLFQRAEEVVESAFVVLLEQEIGKTGCGKEPHPSSFLASFQGNSRCKMCLTCTNRSHKDQVFLGGEKVQISHILLRYAAGKFNGRIPDKLIQGFQYTEPCRLHHTVTAID